jgi:hypothetical protein
MAREVLTRMLHAPYGPPAPTPHQPTVADVSKVIAKATNRTVSFPLFGDDGYSEGSISFEGRAVTWDVPENNHAVERARSTEIAGLFFAALNKVAWTRGTGGAMWGNSEYNEGPHGHGRGADYLGDTYGPLGDEAKVGEYRRNGFSAKQAREMLAASKRPRTAPRPFSRW